MFAFGLPDLWFACKDEGGLTTDELEYVGIYWKQPSELPSQQVEKCPWPTHHGNEQRILLKLKIVLQNCVRINSLISSINNTSQAFAT